MSLMKRAAGTSTRGEDDGEGESESDGERDGVERYCVWVFGKELMLFEECGFLVLMVKYLMENVGFGASTAV